MQFSQCNENASLTSFHTSFTCCAVEPLLILGTRNNDVAISPESLSTCLSKMCKNLLSSLSQLPSVVNTYQRVSNSFFFRLLVIYFANAPVSICVVFELPHQYFFIVLEFGNMILNSLAVRSAVLKWRLCPTRKPEKSSSAFTTFWFKFAITELAPKSVNFVCHCAE